DPLRNTRTTLARWWERLLLAPNRVNYHLEHHLVMTVPHYNLPRMHRLLRARGVLEDACVTRGYLDVLRPASAAPAASRAGAHGVVGAVLHRRIDVGDRAEAALEAADRVHHVGDEEAVHDVAGRVGDHDRRLAEPPGERDAALHRLRRRPQARRHLDQLHGVHRVEEVEADEALGPPGGGGQLGHGERRGVGREDGLGLHDLVEASEVILLHGQL